MKTDGGIRQFVEDNADTFCPGDLSELQEFLAPAFKPLKFHDAWLSTAPGVYVPLSRHVVDCRICQTAFKHLAERKRDAAGC